VHLHGPVPKVNRLARCIEQFLSDSHVVSRFIEQHDELVTAQPGDAVIDADGASEAISEFPQDLITSVMAVEVIDDFEVVKINVEQRGRAFFGQGGIEFHPQQRSVCKTSERIVVRDMFEHALPSLKLRHDNAKLMTLKRQAKLFDDR